jgi:hypothetical protein
VFENQTNFCPNKGFIYFLLEIILKRFKCGVIYLGLFDKVMAKKEEPVDLEEFLNNLDETEDEHYEDADAFVKPMDLVVDADVNAIINEAKSGNLVLVNISDLSKRNALKLKELIGQVKAEVAAIDGDIARISQGRVLVTPSKVKIIKRKGQ